MYSLFVKLSRVMRRNTIFHKENSYKEDFSLTQSFASLPWDTECSRHSHFPKRLKKCARDPQNFPGSHETWAHVQATVRPQVCMLNPVGQMLSSNS